MANNASMKRLTLMLSNTRNYYDEELVYNIYALVREEVQEKVKELVQEELKKAREEIKINFCAYLNGKKFSNEVLEDEIRKEILNTMK